MTQFKINERFYYYVNNIHGGISIYKETISEENLIIMFILKEDSYCCGSFNMGGITVNNHSECLIVLKWLLEDDDSPLMEDDHCEQRTNILCTLVDDRTIISFTKVGFKIIGSFKNCKTDNNVSILQGIIQHDLEYIEYDD